MQAGRGHIRVLIYVHVLVRHGFQNCCLQTGLGQMGPVGEDRALGIQCLGLQCSG
jgi:hypothetical protein